MQHYAWSHICSNISFTSDTGSEHAVGVTSCGRHSPSPKTWPLYLQKQKSVASRTPKRPNFYRARLIQHDCGHGSFFRGHLANDWVSRAIGVVTLTPYDCWRRNHARHHASSGNLDHRGSGDIDTLTVSEFTKGSIVALQFAALIRELIDGFVPWFVGEPAWAEYSNPLCF
jgi:hypothetical protein